MEVIAWWIYGFAFKQMTGFKNEMTAVNPRLLGIRGGATGDFILTLPAIKLLREPFPAARFEVLDYPHIGWMASSARYLSEAFSTAC